MRSLEKCALAGKTHCFIAVDYPPERKMHNEHKTILRLCKKKWTFIKTDILVREKNLGPVENYENALSKIFRNYENVIVLEDDNIVAKNFLVFMNQALIHFAKKKACLGICGHSFSQINKKHSIDVYKAFYFSGWGCGMYKNRRSAYKSAQANKFSSCFLNPKKLYSCLKFHPHIFRIYVESIIRKQSYGDVNLSVHALAKNLFFCYPANTKVINRGHDGTGFRIRRKSHPFPRFFKNENQKKFNFVFSNRQNHAFLLQNKLKFINYQKVRISNFLKLYVMYAFYLFKNSFAKRAERPVHQF